MRSLLNALVLSLLLIPALGLPAHEHKAPHQGTLVVFGDEFAHLELVLDAQEGRLTAYALDGEAEKPQLLAAKSLAVLVKPKVPKAKPFLLRLKAVANALTGEAVGSTSQFSATSPALKGLKDFDGLVQAVTLKGTPFTKVPFNYPLGNEAKEEGEGEHHDAAAHP